jgi:hypothetical protein
MTCGPSDCTPDGYLSSVSATHLETGPMMSCKNLHSTKHLAKSSNLALRLAAWMLFAFQRKRWTHGG